MEGFAQRLAGQVPTLANRPSGRSPAPAGDGIAAIGIAKRAPALVDADRIAREDGGSDQRKAQRQPLHGPARWITVSTPALDHHDRPLWQALGHRHAAQRIVGQAQQQPAQHPAGQAVHQDQPVAVMPGGIRHPRRQPRRHRGIGSPSARRPPCRADGRWAVDRSHVAKRCPPQLPKPSSISRTSCASHASRAPDARRSPPGSEARGPVARTRGSAGDVPSRSRRLGRSRRPGQIPAGQRRVQSTRSPWMRPIRLNTVSPCRAI